jgi:hypothetical protein
MGAGAGLRRGVLAPAPSLEAQVGECLLHVGGEVAVHRVAPARRVVVDDAAPDLLPEDEPELARVGADASCELVQGAALGDLRGPATPASVRCLMAVRVTARKTPTPLSVLL